MTILCGLWPMCMVQIWRRTEAFSWTSWKISILNGLYLGFFLGDFNMMRFPFEKKGARTLTWSMETFFEFINENELIDLPLLGGKFTWSNNQERVAMSRIDRFLLSKEWDEHFVGAISTALPKLISDHSPIKLGMSTLD